ncbi:hypothetical protein L7F22_056293 [Adiantum nelumboides]|nr:hypothetical protein [Adiantum nelumboides]
MGKSKLFNCVGMVERLALVVLLVSLFMVIGKTRGDTYSCAGSTLCSGLAQSDCDAARRAIVPGNLYFTGGAKGSTGVCFGNCGLFVSGNRCDLSGNEMITAFNELRDHDCAKCGIKTYDDGCQFKADYVTGC